MKMKNDSKNKPIFSVSISEEIHGDAASITLQGGLKSNIVKAHLLGYDGVEMQIHTPKRFDWNEIENSAHENNITITAIGTGLEYGINGLCFTSNESVVRKKTRKRFFDFIKIASRFNAVVFLGLCRGTSPSYSLRDIYIEKLYKELLPIAEKAKEYEVILVLEPIVFYLTNLINTSHEAMDFLQRPGLEEIKILLDTHHMFIEDKDYIQSFRDAAEKIHYIHISDSNRKHTGAGNVDFTAIGKVLKEIHYCGPVSSETLPIPTGEESAKRTLEWMKQTWKSV